MAYVFYAAFCLLILTFSLVKCAENTTDAQKQGTKPRIVSSLIRLGKRTNNPLFELLGKSFSNLQNKFDSIEKLVEDANIEKQMEKTDMIMTRLENAINETERRLKQVITEKFETLTEEICNMYTCTEWSEWTECDAETHLDYGIKNRTRECGKTPEFCNELAETKSETESMMCRTRCPSNYTVTSSQYCVKLYTSLELTWENAEQQCQIDGGHLISIDSASKSDQITEILKKENSDGRVWFGGIQRSQNGAWEFSDGTISSGYTNWKSDQPNGDTFPNCMYFLPTYWYWADWGCDQNSYNFMCEIK